MLRLEKTFRSDAILREQSFLNKIKKQAVANDFAKWITDSSSRMGCSQTRGQTYNCGDLTRSSGKRRMSR